MQLVTHQTGPQGQKVRRLLIEEGADIEKEFYLGMVVDRATQQVALMASAEGGMDIEEVAATHPEKIHTVAVDPAAGLSATPRPTTLARKLGIPDGERAAGARGAAGALPAFWETDCSLAEINPLVVTGDGRRDRARRQDELRRQRALPPPETGRDARPRRGRPGRGRGVEVGPQLHPARRQHRLPGERRRARDGDDGHHQALRRRAGELPRRRRRRHHREGDRGVQDHAAQPDGRRRSWSTSSAAS